MVPKTRRLPREAFRSRGYQTTATPYFSVRTKNNFLSVNRIGVVVPKAVDKRATRRNFLERQAKAELLRMPNQGKDIVVTIFPKAAALDKNALRKEMKKIAS